MSSITWSRSRYAVWADPVVSRFVRNPAKDVNTEERVSANMIKMQKNRLWRTHCFGLKEQRNPPSNEIPEKVQTSRTRGILSINDKTVSPLPNSTMPMSKWKVETRFLELWERYKNTIHTSMATQITSNI